MLNADGLKILARSYLHEVDLTALDRAWDLVSRVHEGKVHFAGESYIQHALEVASTLASMHLDRDTVVAGLLHGVLKEGVQVEDLRRDFGASVAEIVDGSTRINNVHYSSKLTHQAENIRKMLLAIAADIRVLLVKLADRLQDMSSLENVDQERQREIARETMDLYAPLASRLGIDWLKRQLEDLSFQFLYPEEFLELTTKLESSLEERQTYVEEVISILHNKLGENKVWPKRIIGRPKHLYSIFKKLQAQKIPLERVYDKVAFRIIVNTVNECYEALGVVHANWAPIPGRIKDFISVPKANNYQSMHTTVAGPRGHFIEIQIRTEGMDRVAQEGIAAHWAYKEGQSANPKDTKLFQDLKKLVQHLQDVEDPREFLDSVRGEFYEPDVYALTPDGEVKEFPQGSTPIDFAFAIHTEVGNHCVGAKISGRLVPLKYELQNGDIVEIITSKSSFPNRGWLNLAKTSRAKSCIRTFLRKEEKVKALNLGREICERELKANGTTLKKLVKSGHVKILLKELHCHSLDDMLVKVGNGNITVRTLLKALQPPELRGVIEPEKEMSPEELAGLMIRHDSQAVEGSGSIIRIDGIDDMLVKVSQCCNPVPGDAIVGFITTGRGVSVHKAECPNLLSSDPHRWIEVYWSGSNSSRHQVKVHISAENRKGIFASISSAINADDVNILEISARTTPAETAELAVTLEVEDLNHLQTVLQHLRQMDAVISATRN
ncbi:MAG: bifunctional (p)ppGpp synthetase/guanosine-3',5'-bis(diphosphate) 3'-pyrophosphohydrolase [Thermodesulfobacteriota bacterium]